MRGSGRSAREGAHQLVEPRVVAEALERDRKLAPPVRLLGLRGARQVDRVEHPEQVLELHDQDARGRAREIGMHRACELGRRGRDRGGIGGRARRQQPLALEREEEPRAVLRALDERRLPRPFVGQQPERSPDGEIAPVPEPRDRRQVMRRCGDQRLGRIGVRRCEAAVRVALEREHPVREDTARGERRAQLGRDGAEILADHHAAVAHAFERDDPEQVVERIAHVRTVRRRATRRHPVQPREPHRVIDAQRARVAHVGAEHRDERRIGGRPQPLRVERRQAPVLPLQVIGVGRCADARGDDVQVLIRPGFSTAAVDRDGEVLVEADAQLERAGVVGRGRKLRFRLPLQVLVELDALELRVGEAGDRGRGRIAKFGRPGGPSPHIGILAM